LAAADDASTGAAATTSTSTSNCDATARHVLMLILPDRGVPYRISKAPPEAKIKNTKWRQNVNGRSELATLMVMERSADWSIQTSAVIG
jgi:hypothetical protein